MNNSAERDELYGTPVLLYFQSENKQIAFLPAVTSQLYRSK